MNIDQITAESAFALNGIGASYASGAGPVPCRVIVDQGIDSFADDRLVVPEITFSLLVSEVGVHQPGATVTVAGADYTVRHLKDDDGYMRRVVVEA